VVNGAGWTAAFDARFLLDAASASDGEELTFMQVNDDSPALIRDYDSRWAAVTMPIVATE
jgi:hypothetical protein